MTDEHKSAKINMNEITQIGRRLLKEQVQDELGKTPMFFKMFMPATEEEKIAAENRRKLNEQRLRELPVDELIKDSGWCYDDWVDGTDALLRMLDEYGWKIVRKESDENW